MIIIRLFMDELFANLPSCFECVSRFLYYLSSLEVVALFLHLLYARCLRRVIRFTSVVIQAGWKHVG